MSLRKLFTNLSLTLRRRTVVGERCFASKAVTEIVTSAEEEPVFLEETSEDLEKKRNKSRLTEAHRNILHGQKPYNQSMEWFHDTVKYKKRMLGRYGMEALGVPAGLAWPTPEEIEDVKEYERVAFPLTLQERWEKIRAVHERRHNVIMAKQEKIHSMMLKMKSIRSEVRQKIAKRKAEAEEAKEKKERRLREVRYQLGLSGHVTSDKIKEMLGKLDKEDKKKRKELKAQRALERQQKFIEANAQVDSSAEKEK